MPPPDRPAPSARFATTCWATVREAAGPEASPSAQAAFARLCETYWYPLYAFARREGESPSDAQDLTQGFFARLVEKRDLGGAQPERARFRSYLIAAFRNFLANARDRERAQKRGGGRHHLTSLDADHAESRYQSELSHGDTPERQVERAWALALLADAVRDVREAYQREGKTELFHALKGTLTGDDGQPGRAALAASLGMGEAALHVAAHRLRLRYREVLRSRVAETVADAADIDDELRHLMNVVAG